MSKLPQGDIVVTDISGPTENSVQGLKNILPNKSNIVIFCGLIGMITGLAGVFIDNILNIIVMIRKRLLEFKR